MAWTKQEKKSYFDSYNKEYNLLLRKPRKNSVREKEIESIKREKEIAAEHLHIIFCGGELGEGKERDFSYNEGEIV